MTTPSKIYHSSVPPIDNRHSPYFRGRPGSRNSAPIATPARLSTDTSTDKYYNVAGSRYSGMQASPVKGQHTGAPYQLLTPADVGTVGMQIVTAVTNGTKVHVRADNADLITAVRRLLGQAVQDKRITAMQAAGVRFSVIKEAIVATSPETAVAPAELPAGEPAAVTEEPIDLSPSLQELVAHAKAESKPIEAVVADPAPPADNEPAAATEVDAGDDDGMDDED